MKNILFLILIFSTACAQDSQEMEVINDTFLKLVGTDYYTEPLPPAPPRVMHPDSVAKYFDDNLRFTNPAYYKELEEEFEAFDWNEYERKLAEWKQLVQNPPVDHRNLVLLVSDSLISYADNNLLRLTLSEYELSEKGFESNFGLSNEWRNLAVSLMDSLQTSLYLNKKLLTHTGRYHIKPVQVFRPSDKDRIVGKLIFSRVVFNSERTKACFYFGFHCGGTCGAGNLVFAELSEGKWKVRTKAQLWVS